MISFKRLVVLYVILTCGFLCLIQKFVWDLYVQFFIQVILVQKSLVIPHNAFIIHLLEHLLFILLLAALLPIPLLVPFATPLVVVLAVPSAVLSAVLSMVR
jgi:hypothetical protein